MAALAGVCGESSTGMVYARVRKAVRMRKEDFILKLKIDCCTRGV